MSPYKGLTHNSRVRLPQSSEGVLRTYPSQFAASITTLGNGAILGYVKINQPTTRGLRPGVEDNNTLSHDATLLESRIQVGEMSALHSDFVGLGVVGEPSTIFQPVSHPVCNPGAYTYVKL